MIKIIKLSIYYLSKYTGMFYVSRFLTRKKLRVLCYHGVSNSIEHEVFNKLFVSPSLLDKRMAYLHKSGIPVLDLDTAVDKLYKNTLPNHSTVITFDDGWSGVYNHAMPILKQYSLPWTLYVTTYYMQNQFQVFNIVLQFIIARTSLESINLSGTIESMPGSYVITQDIISSPLYTSIMQYAESSLTAEQRQQLLLVLAKEFKVDISTLIDTDSFKNITSEQCKSLSDNGVDIQLHTHRHTFPADDLPNAEKEITENRLILEAITKSELKHFCYPSGFYNPSVFDVLSKCGIKSATTIEPGFNDSSSNKYEINRFLDGEYISQIEFEAELAGFSEILRLIFK